jgi:tetratricopeptide (TPR) repeat protein
MLRRCARLAALLIAFSFSTSFAAESGSKPLRASEVIGLVAGNALPENIIADINADHLAFRPDDFYRALLKTAGADPQVLAALDSAKVDTDRSPEDESGKDLLQEMANAAAAMNARKYDQAEAELKSALTDSINSPDVYFVVGDLLRREEEWDKAYAVYDRILNQDPNYPEAETKLSYILYRIGDDESALRDAEMVLQRSPNDAEAHKNAALALEDMKKFTASEEEYEKALTLKPDYAAARYDLGNLYRENGQLDKAIEQYHKAIELDPNEPGAYTNLGATLQYKGDLGLAIQEFRKAKSLDPTDFLVRDDLASALVDAGMFPQAVTEFRELEAMYPDSSMCHVCLANALYETWDMGGAEAEYRKALELDPTDASAHGGLGNIRQQQKDYDGAIKEFQEAEKLDPTYTYAYGGEAAAEIKKGDFSTAEQALDKAERLSPEDGGIHDLYGQALMGLNKPDAAIAEYQQASALEPKQIQIMLRLADAFEAKGDWVSAIQEYRKASLTDAGIDLRGKIIRLSERDPQLEYKKAQDRLKEHLAELRAAGKSSEAAEIESAINGAEANSGLSDQLDAAMLAGSNADRAHKIDEAVKDYQQAVSIAEKIQPHDPRLVTALDDLGNNYLGWNAPAAESAFEQELKAAQDLFGPNSPNLTGPLQSLGRNALMQHDYATAEKFFFQAVDVNEQAFGESSDAVANSLVQASAVYFVEQDYAKAEPFLLRAVHINESLYGADSWAMAIPLSSLCSLYDRWGKPDKFDPCNRQLLAVTEKEYGPNSPVIVPLLQSEAKALRTLGKNEEAEKFDTRAATLRSATMKPN